MEDAPNPQNKLNNDALSSSSKSRTNSLYPTARSLSVITAQSATDPSLVPTALSNSTTTAVGASPSDLDRHSGMSDTSAGSSLNSVNIKSSNTNTAKSPKSSELILNNLRRGSIFGRQSQPLTQSSTNGPKSVTNITFSDNTTFSTASQLTESDASAKEIDVLKKENIEKELNYLNGKRLRSRILEKIQKNKEKSRSGNSKVSQKSTASKMSQNGDVSKKSGVSSRISKPLKLSRKENEDNQLSKKSMKSGKSSKKMQKLKRKDGMDESVSRNNNKSKKARNLSEFTHIKGISQNSMKPQPKKDVSKKSDCARSGDISNKSILSRKGKQQEKSTDLSESTRKLLKDSEKEIQKTDANSLGQKNIGESVRLSDQPAVPNGAKYVAKPASKQGKISTQSTYMFPGAGKCTRNFDTVAPVSPKVQPMEEHCVYDISKLSPARRQMPATKSQKTAKNPRTLFGSAPMKQTKPVMAKATKLPQSSPSSLPSSNKVVVYGSTPDGKNQVEFTIHMRLVSGEALGLSSDPIEMIPRKVIVGGKEIPVDLPKKSDTSESP